MTSDTVEAPAGQTASDAPTTQTAVITPTAVSGRAGHEPDRRPWPGAVANPRRTRVR